MRKKKRKPNYQYLLALIVVALLSFIGLPQLASEELTFRAFDVGQGDSFLFVFPEGSTMLVDAGPRKNGAALAARLRELGIRRIDILVATHPHEDHIGGMSSVLGSFEIGKVWDSGYNHGSSIQRDMLAIIRSKEIRFGRPRAGFVEQIGEAKVEVLGPKTLVTGDANNSGLVLRVSYGAVSFLMMGDVEKPGLAGAGAMPPSTILKVAHHGSRNGTSAQFLREVAPEVAVISFERDNRYGHPHKEALKRLEKGRAELYNTADGEIKIVTDGAKYSITQ